MITIVLSRGYVTVIDGVLPEDLQWVLGVSWYAHKSRNGVYARNRKYGFLHRILAGTRADHQTDHINGDTLDNRRENLRNVTARTNIRAMYKRREQDATAVAI